MWVYGDIEREAGAGDERRAIAAALRHCTALAPGLERHAALAAVFIRTSELVQAVADAEHAVTGCDGRSIATDSGSELLALLATTLWRSWTEGFAAAVDTERLLPMLASLDSPAPLRLRRAEGYALYCLYPESFGEAALASGLGPETRVIGIRSIGTGLAAMVAAVLGAPPPLTLRPVGDPFQRRVAASSDLAAEVARCARHDHAIVDEGPGLSGSSFAAVAQWLEENGVPPSRIRFFPSHGGGPGGEASPAIRSMWQRRPRHVREAGTTLLSDADPAHRLETWVAGVVGPLLQPLEEISGGTWRTRQAGTTWPPANPQLERRKFLARSSGGTFLVKFAGLGEEGQRKLATAKTLAAAGFHADIAGLCHGWLIERWLDGTPLPGATVARERLIAALGDYLGLRGSLPAPYGGSTLSTLAEMARCNAAEGLGANVAIRLEPLLQAAGELEARANRVNTDNRLHAWEWLLSEDGRLVKTDALDHSAAHDLIGCQDIAWDIVGAAVEHGLDDAELEQLCARVEARASYTVDRRLLALLRPCYLAFELGYWTQAAQTTAAEDNGRQRAAVERYRALLQQVVWRQAA